MLKSPVCSLVLLLLCLEAALGIRDVAYIKDVHSKKLLQVSPLAPSTVHLTHIEDAAENPVGIWTLVEGSKLKPVGTVTVWLEADDEAESEEVGPMADGDKLCSEGADGSMTATGNHVHVKVDVNAGLRINETQLWVGGYTAACGVASYPGCEKYLKVDKFKKPVVYGNPAYGKFPYRFSKTVQVGTFDYSPKLEDNDPLPGFTSVTYRIPLADFMAATCLDATRTTYPEFVLHAGLIDGSGASKGGARIDASDSQTSGMLRTSPNWTFFEPLACDCDRCSGVHLSGVSNVPNSSGFNHKVATCTKCTPQMDGTKNMCSENQSLSNCLADDDEAEDADVDAMYLAEHLACGQCDAGYFMVDPELHLCALGNNQPDGACAENVSPPTPIAGTNYLQCEVCAPGYERKANKACVKKVTIAFYSLTEHYDPSAVKAGFLESLAINNAYGAVHLVWDETYIRNEGALLDAVQGNSFDMLIAENPFGTTISPFTESTASALEDVLSDPEKKLKKLLVWNWNYDGGEPSYVPGMDPTCLVKRGAWVTVTQVDPTTPPAVGPAGTLQPWQGCSTYHNYVLPTCNLDSRTDLTVNTDSDQVSAVNYCVGSSRVTHSGTIPAYYLGGTDCGTGRASALAYHTNMIYYATRQGLCHQCDADVDNCEACLPDDSTTCQTCKYGYYLVAGVCTSCSDAHPGCGDCTNLGICLNCRDGYSFINGVCTDCSTVIEHCGACSGDFDGTPECHGCTAGYVLVDGQCVPGCSHTFVLVDYWGDGWNGNQIEVSFGSSTLYVLDLPSGSYSQVSLTVPAGQVSIKKRHSGSWPEEVGLIVYNGDGTMLYTLYYGTFYHYSDGDTLFSWTNTCPSEASNGDQVEGLAVATEPGVLVSDYVDMDSEEIQSILSSNLTSSQAESMRHNTTDASAAEAPFN